MQYQEVCTLSSIVLALDLIGHNMVFIPLRAKRVGEFIEIRHKKISPTLGCLSLYTVE